MKYATDLSHYRRNYDLTSLLKQDRMLTEGPLTVYSNCVNSFNMKQTFHAMFW
jgi:hypothetical protein